MTPGFHSTPLTTVGFVGEEFVSVAYETYAFWGFPAKQRASALTDLSTAVCRFLTKEDNPDATPLVSEVVSALVTKTQVSCYADPSTLRFSDQKKRHDYQIKIGQALRVEVSYFYTKAPMKHLAQFVPTPEDLTLRQSQQILPQTLCKHLDYCYLRGRGRGVLLVVMGQCQDKKLRGGYL